MIRAVIATTKPWNIAYFKGKLPTLPGAWRLIEHPEELTAEFVRDFSPDYIFFPHWSWRVPDDILDLTECVCFHMTDVPAGRGGTPLQNLISRGHTKTVVSALRMVHEMDAGPVYSKVPLSLDGRAQEIYERATALIADMILHIVNNRPVPVPQVGEPTIFPRRKPEDSRLPLACEPAALYDHIRMLDAETYPHAFLDYGSFRLEFTHATQTSDGVEARVMIKRKEKSS
jgi:methionyl-tRNA formyltransferase